MRTDIASPIGDALYRSGLTGMMNKHLAEIGNQVNTSWPEAANALNGLEQQAMLSALQELYGYTFLFGMAYWC